MLRGQQVISSSGAMLTASWPTTFTLNVEKENSTFNHVISGSLKSDGSGVIGKQIKILVNDTEKAGLITELEGQFSTTLNLPTLNNKPTTYRIAATFEGDEFANATAYAYTPNGTQCAVCTTIQHGYNPSSSSLSLTVEPQATQVMTPTKTPEQLQAEAEQSGWLTIWHEFTWWYPWYRIHYVYSFEGEVLLDAGYALLPWADTFNYSQAFVARINNIISTLTGIVIGVAIDFIVLEIILIATHYLGPIAFALGVLSWFGGKTVSVILSWNSMEALKGAFLGTIVSIGLDIFEFLYSFRLSALRELRNSMERMKTLAYKLLAVFANFLYNFILLGWIDNRLRELGGSWWEI